MAGKRKKTQRQRDQLLANLREGMTIEAACAQSRSEERRVGKEKTGEDGRGS